MCGTSLHHSVREAGREQTKPLVAKGNTCLSTSPFLQAPVLAFLNCSCPLSRVCSPARAGLSARTGLPSPPTLLPNLGAMGSPRPRPPAVEMGRPRLGSRGSRPPVCASGMKPRSPAPVISGWAPQSLPHPPHSPGPLPPALPANLGSAFRDDLRALARGSSGRTSAPLGSPLPPASPPPPLEPAPLDAAIPGQPHWA